MVSSTLLSFQSVKPHSSVAVDLDGPGRQQDFRGERLSILETNEEDEEEDVDIFETFDEFPTGDLPTFAKGGPGGLGGLREPGEDQPPEPSTKQRDERHRT